MLCYYKMWECAKFLDVPLTNALVNLLGTECLEIGDYSREPIFFFILEKLTREELSLCYSLRFDFGNASIC